MAINHTESINFLSQVSRRGKTPQAFISIGIPGSGKTTFMTSFAKSLGIKRVSPDEICEAMTGDSADQSKNREVWEVTHDLVREELQANRSVIVDATHTSPESRRDAAIKYKQWGATALIAVMFDVSLEVALQRNSDRDRVVPDRVIENMYASLHANIPSFDEGIDMIFTNFAKKNTSEIVPVIYDFDHMID